MTNDELNAIEARANAATPGEWDASVAYDETVHAVVGGFSSGATPTNEDAKFVVNARQDVPALIAEVRRLREFAGCMAQSLRYLHSFPDAPAAHDSAVEYVTAAVSQGLLNPLPDGSACRVDWRA